MLLSFIIYVITLRMNNYLINRFKSVAINKVQGNLYSRISRLLQAKSNFHIEIVTVYTDYNIEE